MSSHHIVRDDQEPALIIANGEACNIDLMHQLLEWSPLVVVLDSAIDRVLELGIKIDVLLGDFDRGFNSEKYKELQYPLEIIPYSCQNSTDLEKAFHFLIERGHKMANVIWATGKRMDHTLNNITCIAKFSQQLEIVLFDDYSKIFVLPKTYKKWYTKDTVISLMPIGKVEGITTKNLVYPLQNDSLELGVRTGNSNSVLEDGIVEITYERGHLLMMECWD
ncbi:thiamine diphosphokinase [Capnocytophaga sp. ARDL2]|uniref:thiamine diphosphokinase n=1 Tax=Capnocytophaga sp. ARDL2 TaxID=3238809 RepID=UPI003555E625